MSLFRFFAWWKYKSFLGLFVLVAALAGIITYSSLQLERGILIKTPGGASDFAKVLGLSNSGQVLLFVRNDKKEEKLFFWTKAQGLQEINALDEKGFDKSGVKMDKKTGQIVSTNDGAFVWSQASGLHDIGLLGRDNRIYALNRSGQFVGSAEFWGKYWSGSSRMPRGVILGAGEFIGRSSQAFLWTKDQDDLQSLGDLGFGESIATAINDAGQVVGLVATKDLKDISFDNLATDGPNGPSDFWEKDDDGSPHAFLWTKEQGMQDLGTLGGTRSEAQAINNAGQVVGRSHMKDGGEHAFLWTKEQGMQDLGTLGGEWSWTEAINEAGQILGYSETKAEEPRAFFWTEEKGMQDLGTLGGKESRAEAMNEAGQIIGRSLDQDGKYHAFIWTQEKGMQPLHELGGTSSGAKFINDKGQIVGTIDYVPPWWANIWKWCSDKLNLPEPYKPDMRNYSYSQVAFWEVPLPAGDEGSKSR